MDFKDSMTQIADRVDKMKDNIKTEESTKNAFIMPLIRGRTTTIPHAYWIASSRKLKTKKQNVH